MLGIVLLITLMLGASSPGYGVEISTKVLYDLDKVKKWPVTGWNEYYDTLSDGKRYEDILSAKKTSYSRRKTDPGKVFASNTEAQEMSDIIKKIK